MKPTVCKRCFAPIKQPPRGKRLRCIKCSEIVNREKNTEDKKRSRIKRILSEQRSPLLSKGQRAIMGSS